MKNQFRVSVITTNYNHGHFLPRSLENLLKDSRFLHEILLIDDGSTDDSLKVMKEYQEKYPHLIRVIDNGKNLGVVRSVNGALSKATGDYVYFHSADDVTRLGIIEKSINILKKHPEAGLCCGDFQLFRGNNPDENLTNIRYELSEKECFFSPKELESVMRGDKSKWVSGSTAIVRRDAVVEMGGLVEGLKWHCDWFLLMGIAFKYGICYMPEFLAANYISEKAYSAGMHNEEEQRAVMQTLIDHMMKKHKKLAKKFSKARSLFMFNPMFKNVVLSDSRNWKRSILSLVESEEERYVKRKGKLVEICKIEEGDRSRFSRNLEEFFRSLWIFR